MLVEWKEILTQNRIPENRWPVSVLEIDSAHPQSVAPKTMARVTYPAGISPTVVNPATGLKEWNPEVKDSLELIYNAYRNCLGKLGPPRFNRAGNFVSFDQSVPE